MYKAINSFTNFVYDAFCWLVVIAIPISYLLAVMNELLSYNWN